MAASFGGPTSPLDPNSYTLAPSAMGGPLMLPAGGWPASMTQLDQPTAYSVAQEAAAKKAADERIAQLVAGGSDYWSNAQNAQANAYNAGTLVGTPSQAVKDIAAKGPALVQNVFPGAAFGAGPGGVPPTFTPPPTMASQGQGNSNILSQLFNYLPQLRQLFVGSGMSQQQPQQTPSLFSNQIPADSSYGTMRPDPNGPAMQVANRQLPPAMRQLSMMPSRWAGNQMPSPFFSSPSDAFAAQFAQQRPFLPTLFNNSIGSWNPSPRYVAPTPAMPQQPILPGSVGVPASNGGGGSGWTPAQAGFGP